MTSIRDVAKLAKVSPATVSRVMNGTANVDEEKKTRVKQAIFETGFRPNEVARSLFKKSSKIIGMIVPNIENPFFNELANAVEEECYTKGYRMTLCSSNNNLDKEKKNLNLLSRMNADGIIFMTNQDTMVEEVKKYNIPIVMIDRQISGSSAIACIQSDHYKGGRLAVEHLLECGCKKIVHMTGPLRFSSARSRKQAYIDMCNERQVEPFIIECDYDYDEGLKKAEELLEKYKEADGIIAANDMVAISVYKVLTKRGIKVPEDVQLIGFDNINLCRYMTPEITTIAQPIKSMGCKAVDILLDYEEGEKIDNSVFDVTLIKRETTKGEQI